jgi:hypothetical protein
MKPIQPCDDDVFKKGVSLLAIDGRSAHVEPWVQSVAERSGQRVDWHYSGGVAHVLVLGDHAKAMAAANELAPKLLGRIMRRYEPQDAGLYRAGVTEAPEDAIGAVTTSGETEWIGSSDTSSNASDGKVGG